MATTNNLLNITQMKSKEDDRLYHDVVTYFRMLDKKSHNTAIAYKNDIDQFFMFMLNKPTEQITLSELQFKYADIVRYQLYLGERYAPTTVNRKIASVRSFFEFLEKNYPDKIKTAIFKVDKVREVGINHSGILTWEEVLQMIEIVKKQRKGTCKALLIETATITGIRVDALLRLELKDIKQIDGYRVIEVLDKGQKIDEKPISEELYQRIVAYVEKRKSNETRIFDISKKSVNNMMKQLREEMNISHERNITFHSFKKTGINEVWQITGDLMAVAQQGNHSDPTTTMKFYMEQCKDWSKMGSMLIGKPVDVSPLESLSKQELLKLIKRCNRGIQIELMKQFENMKNEVIEESN